MRHGSASTYNNHRCRCELCRAAWAVYFAARRQKRMAAGGCRDCAQGAVPGKKRCERHLAMAVAACRRYQARVRAAQAVA